jgi:hypothetical protein
MILSLLALNDGGQIQNKMVPVLFPERAQAPWKFSSSLWPDSTPYWRLLLEAWPRIGECRDEFCLFPF